MFFIGKRRHYIFWLLLLCLLTRLLNRVIRSWHAFLSKTSIILCSVHNPKLLHNTNFCPINYSGRQTIITVCEQQWVFLPLDKTFHFFPELRDIDMELWFGGFHIFNSISHRRLLNRTIQLFAVINRLDRNGTTQSFAQHNNICRHGNLHASVLKLKIWKCLWAHLPDSSRNTLFANW